MHMMFREIELEFGKEPNVKMEFIFFDIIRDFNLIKKTINFSKENFYLISFFFNNLRKFPLKEKMNFRS